MSIRGRLTVLAMFLPFAAFAQPKLPPPGPTSAEDCAALAPMLRASLPDIPGGKGKMYANSYGVDCDWKALGVEAPRTTSARITSAQSGGLFWFAKPDDSNDGQRRRIERDQGYWKNGGDNLAVGYCDAEKENGKWQLVACDTGMYFTPD